MTVRVRYAPSPTGEPHVGNLRTALFNWLFARHEGGIFVLRIEDTDRVRLVPGAVDRILESLRWLGLDWDEGPEVGGPFAPYFQSERREVYQEAAHRLVRQGDAYLCYCPPERLEALRQEQQARRAPPGYDRRCRDLTAEQRQSLEAQELTPVVRLKLPLTGSTAFEDYLRGAVTVENATMDDFVLLKSDAYPTYHLAAVLDDHLMRITHVLRGEEWISSTPRHILLQRALGIPAPVYVHLPSILGPDRARLGKRHGAVPVLAYRDQGYLPEAFFNFLALLGWSLDDRTEIIRRADLVRHFSLERLKKSPAIFDREKLDDMNGRYLRQVLSEEEVAEAFAGALEGSLPPEVPRPLDGALVRRLVPILRERVERLTQVTELARFFFVEGELEYDAATLLGKGFREDPDRGRQLLAAALARLEEGPHWRHEPLEAAMRELAAEERVKAGDLFMLLRVAVTGAAVTPPLFESLEILGRERSLARLRSALQRLSLPVR